MWVRGSAGRPFGLPELSYYVAFDGGELLSFWQCFSFVHSWTVWMVDNATVVRRFGKRRSKHALNSIHKSYTLQNNWFKCDGLGKRHKNTYSSICQTVFSPLTSMRCTKTISRPGMHSRPQRTRSFLCWLKGARPLGTKMKEGNAESHCWHTYFIGTPFNRAFQSQ